jgi:hypothetical protein
MTIEICILGILMCIMIYLNFKIKDQIRLIFSRIEKIERYIPWDINKIYLDNELLLDRMNVHQEKLDAVIENMHIFENNTHICSERTRSQLDYIIKKINEESKKGEK